MNDDLFAQLHLSGEVLLNAFRAGTPRMSWGIDHKDRAVPFRSRQTRDQWVAAGHGRPTVSMKDDTAKVMAVRHMVERSGRLPEHLQ